MAKYTTTCPVCEAQITFVGYFEPSEIISCYECQSRLTVENIQDNTITLQITDDDEEDEDK